MDLPYVVQQSCSLDLLDFSGGEAQLERNRSGHGTDSKRMTGRIRVTSFDCLNHYLEQLLPTFLKLMVEPVYMAHNHDRNKCAKEDIRAQAEIPRRPGESPGDRQRNCTGSQVVSQHPARVEIPNIAERAAIV